MVQYSEHGETSTRSDRQLVNELGPKIGEPSLVTLTLTVVVDDGGGGEIPKDGGEGAATCAVKCSGCHSDRETVSASLEPRSGMLSPVVILFIICGLPLLQHTVCLAKC